MNFYLLSSILIAVCYLARADEDYATIRLYACTGVKPAVSCPFQDKQGCDSFCSVIEGYNEHLQNNDHRCPWSSPPIFCPYNTGIDCLHFCNNPGSYKPYDVPFDHYR